MSRIPRSDSKFNNYVNETTTYLLATPGGAATTNWERLGLTTAEKNQWVAHKNEWNTAYATVVNNNELGVRSASDTKAKNDAKRNFKDFVIDPEANLLNRIAASPEVTDEDREMFNIKVRDDNPTPRPAITTTPFPEMLPMGGGMVKITVRVQNDANRASMHPDADSIEMRYHIGTSPPQGANQGTQAYTYKGAIHTFSAGTENTAKRLYAFFRWKNNSDLSKSGPYSSMVQVVIA